MKSFKDGGPFIRRLILLIIIGGSVSGTSCRHDPTIWKTEVPSPDRSWVASASTFQTGGFGTASIQTVVYLKRSGASDSPTQVLDFSCEGPAPQPYVLDNANAGGTIHLAIQWTTPTHLELTYDGHAIPYFRVNKIGGIDVSVRDLSELEVRSPAGKWLATARSQGLLGTDLETDVFLGRTDATRAPERVLSFRSDAATYMRSGTLDLRLKWVTPSHLDVTYDGCLSPRFRLVKYAGIEISLHEVESRDLSRGS